MVLEKLKRWRTKTFSGSDAFCHGENATAEPSSKSAHNLQQVGLKIDNNLCSLSGKIVGLMRWAVFVKDRVVSEARCFA